MLQIGTKVTYTPYGVDTFADIVDGLVGQEAAVVRHQFDNVWTVEFDGGRTLAVRETEVTVVEEGNTSKYDLFKLMETTELTDPSQVQEQIRELIEDTPRGNDEESLLEYVQRLEILSVLAAKLL